MLDEGPSPVRLKDLDPKEWPQERLQRLGPSALSEIELLALLIRTGGTRLDVLGLSNLLLKEAGSLKALLRWNGDDFRRIPGIGKVKALQLITVMEFGRRVIVESDQNRPPLLESPEQVYERFRHSIAPLDVEKFWVCALNRKNRLIRHYEVTSGTATSSLVHPREVFRDAIRVSATAIIAVHNHPSGDPAPSAADIQVTRQLKKAGEVLDIPLLDHVIIGDPDHDPCQRGFYSFSEAGLL